MTINLIVVKARPHILILISMGVQRIRLMYQNTIISKGNHRNNEG